MPAKTSWVLKRKDGRKIVLENSRAVRDELGLLLHDRGIDDAVMVANGLLKAVEHHAFAWGNNTFTVGASIGLVPVTPMFRRVTSAAGGRRGLP